MKRLHMVFHLLMYYLAWFAGIKLAAKGHDVNALLIVLLITCLQILWQFKVMKKTRGLFYLIFLFAVTGAAIDSIFVRTGVIHFVSNPFSPDFTAPWMLAIWINFAVLFYALLQNFFKRYLFLAFLCFFGFTFAYAIGAKMGAASFPHGYWSSFIVGSVWTLCLPVCMYFYNRTVK